MSAVVLSALPKPAALTDLSFSSIREQWAAALEGIDTDLYASLVPGDVCYEVLQIGAMRDLYTRARVNDATRQRFMALAYGAGLDELGRVLELERDPGELDDDYRARIHAAERSKGTGSQARYERAVIGASPYVADARAFRYGDSRLIIYWTPTIDSDAGQRADALADVASMFADGDADGFEVRMLTDLIIGQAMGYRAPYDLTAHLHLAPGPDPAEAVARATESVVALCNGPLRNAGTPVPLSELYAALSVVGVEKVDISDPATDIIGTDSQYQELETLTITHETAAWLL